MPMTPASSTTAYCTPAQAVQFFDPATWGDLLTDTGTQLTAAQLLTDPILQADLLAASGEIEEAILCGGRYRPADLVALQAANTAGGLHLAKLVATLAMWNATERRYREARMTERIMRAYDSLDRLRTGEAIFSFDEVQAAGNPSMQKWYEDLDDMQRSPVYQSRRMFGSRHLTDY